MPTDLFRSGLNISDGMLVLATVVSPDREPATSVQALRRGSEIVFRFNLGSAEPGTISGRTPKIFQMDGRQTR